MIQRTVYLADDRSILDGETIRGPLPDHYRYHGPGQLFTAMSQQLEGMTGVLLLDGSWAYDDLDEETILTDIRAAGWECPAGKITTWTAYTKGPRDQQITLYVCYVPKLTLNEGSPDRNPFTSAWGDETAYRLDLWHKTTGAPWFGTPGLAGTQLLRHLVDTPPKEQDQRRSRSRHTRDTTTTPKWQTKNLPDHLKRDWNAPEKDYDHRDWSRTAPGRYLHTYDTNNQYLSACGMAMLARDPLTHTGARPFDKTLSGMWLVEFGRWSRHNDRCPNPAGYARGDQGGARWVASATLEVVQQQVEMGNHTGFKVVDSYTAKGYRVMKDWAEMLRDLRPHPVLGHAVKPVYTETWGMIGRPGGRIYRPDWRAAILAESRAQIFRAIWRHGTEDQVWPVKVDADEITYASDEPDIDQARPASMRYGTDPQWSGRLGTFKRKVTVDTRSGEVRDE